MNAMEKFSGKITIYNLIEGAREATGLAVIIDVFRAFSLEPYLFSLGAASVRPVGSIEETFAWKEKDPNCLLVGERGGAKIEGFDFGNSPSSVSREKVEGKNVIHTTSAGTQGIVNAVHADEIITGSLVNAKAVARYIRKQAPQQVSLVCMGNAGVAPAQEDQLCARYIKALLTGEDLPDMEKEIEALRTGEGKKFFVPEIQHIFPQMDFTLCTRYDSFDFVLKVEKDDQGYLSRRIDL